VVAQQVLLAGVLAANRSSFGRVFFGNTKIERQIQKSLQTLFKSFCHRCYFELSSKNRPQLGRALRGVAGLCPHNSDLDGVFPLSLLAPTRKHFVCPWFEVRSFATNQSV
jgi:hypothetical protein